MDGAGAVVMKMGCIEFYETIYVSTAPMPAPSTASVPSMATFINGFSTHCPTAPLDAIERRMALWTAPAPLPCRVNEP